MVHHQEYTNISDGLFKGEKMRLYSSTSSRRLSLGWNKYWPAKALAKHHITILYEHISWVFIYEKPPHTSLFHMQLTHSDLWPLPSVLWSPTAHQTGFCNGLRNFVNIYAADQQRNPLFPCWKKKNIYISCCWCVFSGTEAHLRMRVFFCVNGGGNRVTLMWHVIVVTAVCFVGYFFGICLCEPWVWVMCKCPFNLDASFYWLAISN